jgi:hypothetical protein
MSISTLATTIYPKTVVHYLLYSVYIIVVRDFDQKYAEIFRSILEILIKTNQINNKNNV